MEEKTEKHPGEVANAPHGAGESMKTPEQSGTGPIGQTAQPTEAPPVGQAAKKLGKPKWLWGFIAVVLIALIGGLLWFSSSRQRAEEVDTEAPVAQETDRQATIVVGAIAENEEEKADKEEEFQPFIDYLASQLGSYGITKGELVTTKRPADMANLLRQGKVDLYFETPFAALVVNKLVGSEPLVNRWKKGVEKYHSAIFTKSDSGIATLDDLKGEMIAFEVFGSTSAYFLPKAELTKRGYKLTEKTGPNDLVAADEIGYYFAGGDVKLLEDVINGIAAAGGQNEVEINEFLQESGLPKGFIRILAVSPDVFRHVVSVRKDLDPKLKDTVKEALLGMDKTPEGRAVLTRFKKTKKFSEFMPSPEVAFAEIEKLVEFVEEEIVRR